MAFGELGTQALRAENVDRVIKGLATPRFTMKQALSVVNSGAWSESYYRESDTELTATAKIARLAAFPQQSPIWEKQTAYNQKHGLEVDISIEDVLADNIDVLARSQLRIARAVTKSVDDLIYTTLSTATGVRSVATTVDYEWDSTTRGNRHPQDQIGQAIEDIQEKNYEATHLFVNPRDYRLLVTNDDVLDAFTPTQNLMLNGVMGTLLGLTVVKSNAVPADEALVLEAKTCGTYREVAGLRTEVIDVPGIKKTVRAWEIGVPFVTDPNAVVRITNTNL